MAAVCPSVAETDTSDYCTIKGQAYGQSEEERLCGPIVNLTD